MQSLYKILGITLITTGLISGCGGGGGDESSLTSESGSSDTISSTNADNAVSTTETVLALSAKLPASFLIGTFEKQSESSGHLSWKIADPSVFEIYTVDVVYNTNADPISDGFKVTVQKSKYESGVVETWMQTGIASEIGVTHDRENSSFTFTDVTLGTGTSENASSATSETISDLIFSGTMTYVGSIPKGFSVVE